MHAIHKLDDFDGACAQLQIDDS